MAFISCSNGFRMINRQSMKEGTMQSATMIFKDEKDIVMHIATLVRIAMADGKFLDSEKAFIANTASLYAGAYGTKPFETMVDECIANLPKTALDEWLSNLAKHPVEAKNLVKDMIALGHVDGDYCEEERKSVCAMAACLNVKEDVVTAIEAALANLIAAARNLQLIIGG